MAAKGLRPARGELQFMAIDPIDRYWSLPTTRCNMQSPWNHADSVVVAKHMPNFLCVTEL